MSYFLTYMIGRLHVVRRLHVSSVSICLSLLVEGQTPQLYGRLQPKVRNLESNSTSILSLSLLCLPGQLIFFDQLFYFWVSLSLFLGLLNFFGLCPF